MRKRLSIVGNSLALVIDKPIRNMLGIGPNTLLQLTTDGRRLIIEPAGEDRSANREATVASGRLTEGCARVNGKSQPAPAEVDALGIFLRLLNERGMTAEQFSRLHHTGARLSAYLGWLKMGIAENAAPVELATMQRLRACLEHLRAGLSWHDAINASLVAVPIEVDQGHATA